MYCIIPFTANNAVKPSQGIEICIYKVVCLFSLAAHATGKVINVDCSSETVYTEGNVMESGMYV